MLKATIVKKCEDEDGDGYSVRLITCWKINFVFWRPRDGLLLYIDCTLYLSASNLHGFYSSRFDKEHNKRKGRKKREDQFIYKRPRLGYKWKHV